MRRLEIITPPLYLLVALVAGACSREAEVDALSFPKASIVLISIDTLRADHLPAYGYQGVETPNLDALAREGIAFDRAWSHCPMTLPSHVSMLTGLLPTEHGVRNNAGFTWDPTKHVALPSVLARTGYATGAVVSSFVLRGETGMDRAFEIYDDAIDPEAGAPFVEHQRSGELSAARARGWLDSVGDRPFFLLLHLYEPHVPYAPPEPFLSRYPNAYDGEIATADAIVGRFLDDLKRRGLYDDAIIVLTSDHGEGLGDHGELQHSILLYRESIHVPLIVKLPRSARGGTRVEAPVGLSDIAPTLARLTGVSFTASTSSADLFDAPASRNIYAETIYPYLQLGWSDLRGLVNERWQLIDGPKPELYDLDSDPKQTRNVLDANRRLATSMLAEVRRHPAATRVEREVDAEVASKLASLGYIGAVRDRPDSRSLPNPNEAIAILDEMQRAFALVNQKQFSEAIPALQAILKKYPRMQEVHVRLAEALDAAGRHGESLAEYRAALSSSRVVMPDLLLVAGEVALRAERMGEASEMAKLVRSSNPIQAASLEARIALARGDLRPAIDFADAAERLAGRSVFGMSLVRGEANARLEKPAAAISEYRREIAAFPAHGDAYARLAIVLLLTGDQKGAGQALNELARIDRALAARTRAVLGL